MRIRILGPIISGGNTYQPGTYDARDLPACIVKFATDGVVVNGGLLAEVVGDSSPAASEDSDDPVVEALLDALDSNSKRDAIRSVAREQGVTIATVESLFDELVSTGDIIKVSGKWGLNTSGRWGEV